MNNLTVLYVEDDDFSRQIFELFLAEHTEKVIVAKDGAEGWRLFNACKPDLVVTDICMPVMDGLQMAALIRENNPAVPIVFVTSSPERLSEFEQFDVHIDFVCNKSVNFHEFSEMLKRYAPSKAGLGFASRPCNALAAV